MPTLRHQVLLAPAVLLALTAGPPVAEAQSSFCKQIDVDLPGALPNTTVAHGINNRGDVVGWFYRPWDRNDDGVIEQGFLLKDGAYKDIQVGDTNTEVYGINDRGDMVGEAGGRGFVIKDGVVSFLDLGGGPTESIAAYDINNHGDIVGTRRAPPDFHQTGFFKLAVGGWSEFTYGGIDNAGAFGINDNRLVVGWATDGFRSAAFYSQGNLVETRPFPNYPGGVTSTLWSVNNAGVVLGDGGSFQQGGAFTRPIGPRERFSPFTCGSNNGVAALGINDFGAVVGYYNDASGQHGFYTPPTLLLDPVPDFVKTTRDVTTDAFILATQGRPVQGISADGVTQIVVRIPVPASGTAVTVEVYKDETTPATDARKYGTVGEAGGRCPGNGCVQTQVTATSRSAAGGAWAFVVYRAPEDFVRDDGDANLKSRDVFLRIESSGGTALLPVKVVRPPLAMLHGQFADELLWKNFRPLVGGPDNIYAANDPRFAILRIPFGENIGARIAPKPPYPATNPLYPPDIIANTTASAMGFEFGAKLVQERVRQKLATFKTGRNPPGLSVAAVQADFVVHSMGGNVTRTMPLLPDFLQGNTYGQGIVHKLITIDTPHKGSVLATELVRQMSAGHDAVPFFLGRLGGSVALRWAYVDGRRQNGSVADLVQNPPSPAIQATDTQTIHQIPTAFIAGKYIDWPYLQGGLRIGVFRNYCQGDALAAQLTPTGWPALFGEDNDGTVGMTSQDPFTMARRFPGYVHSDGMTSLGFKGPTIISNENGGEVALHTISLLNKPVWDTQTYKKLP
jgi:uncharacterized membrane protein